MTGANQGIAEALALLDLAHQVRLVLNSRAQELTGLSIEQAFVLCQIDLSGGATTISELAERVGRASHTLSSRVNWLEKNGLVVRLRRDGPDRRYSQVSLTPQGAAHLAEYRRHASTILDSVFADPLGTPVHTTLRQLTAALQQLMGPYGTS